MIEREDIRRKVISLLSRYRVVAILGARQVGKTTLAKQVADAWSTGPATRFDLEDPADLARIEESSLTLRNLKGLVILDEIQRRPDLFPLLRVLADRDRPATRFLILGSASVWRAESSLSISPDSTWTRWAPGAPINSGSGVDSRDRFFPGATAKAPNGVAAS
ncbi:MAG: putative ATPase [Actinobacteria bacterium]|nr:putative ATPase [Actinomycetota bacterium]